MYTWRETGNKKQINDKVAVIQISDWHGNIPSNLQNQIIKSKRKDRITQWLIWDKNAKDMTIFLNNFDRSNVAVKEVSLKELFFYLTTAELAP